MKVEFCDLCGKRIHTERRFEFNFQNNHTEECNHGIMCEDCFRMIDGMIKGMQANNQKVLFPLLYGTE